MKFTVSSNALLKQLQSLSGLTKSSSTLPILSHFLMVIKGSTLTTTASDLETTASISMPVEAKSVGAVAISANVLVKALKFMPGQHLTFAVDNKHELSITSERGTYHIAGMDAGQYPKTPEVSAAAAFSIPASVLNGAIDKTIWCVGNDDLRPVMSGLFFELSKKITRFVATDAHKLVIQSYKNIKQPQDGSFIVPNKTMKALSACVKNMSGDIAVLVNETRASFDIGDVSVVSRLVDGKYPRYEAVIPKDHTSEISIDRAELLECIQRTKAFTSTMTHQVRFTMSEKSVVIDAEDLDSTNRAKETLSCTFKGKALRIGFNAHFLIQILGSMTCKRVTLKMSEPNKAAIISPIDEQDGESTVALLMPVMLNE